MSLKFLDSGLRFRQRWISLRLKLFASLPGMTIELCDEFQRHHTSTRWKISTIMRTKTKSPKTNRISERFHKTVPNEFYRVTFRKKGYRSLCCKPIWMLG
jgi:hypothetical protein